LRIVVRKLNRSDYLGDLAINVRIILKCMLKKTRWNSKVESSASGTISLVNFRDQRSGCYFVRNKISLFIYK
jgi:hypothetical protein